MSAVNLEALHRWKRFGASGIANTIIGSLAIFTLQIITKNANLSNAVGYLIGSAFGYFIHAQYTFRAKPSLKSMIAYSGVAIACFALNLGVLNLFLIYTSPFLAQFASICSYVVASYILHSKLAFPTSKRRRAN